MATMGRRSWKYVGSSALTGGEVLKWSAKDKVDLSTADTDVIIGVAGEACAAGDTTAQNISVISPTDEPTVQAIAGASITAGLGVMPTTGGKVITTTGTHFSFAYANEAAGADGDVIEIVWCVGPKAVHA
jgi:hypothetical protein